MKSVSIVIPNFNGKKLLESYIPSIYRAIKKASVMAEIIVIDDASTDNSVEFLRHNYPEIRTFVNQNNNGFGKSCNRGFAEAKNDIIACLNTDMELREDFFSHQIPLFDENSAFAVMCRIMNGTKDCAIETCKRIKWHKSDGFRIYNHPDDPQQLTKESIFACGGNALYDRLKLLELNGYSELYEKFYYEDVDLCIRAWRKGWSTYYTSKTECYHQHSATIKSHYNREEIRLASKTNFLKLVYYHSSTIERQKMLAKCQLKYKKYRYLSLFSQRYKRWAKAYLHFMDSAKSSPLFNIQQQYSYSLQEILNRFSNDEVFE